MSLVFTGKDTGRVSPRLRSLIFAAAEELGYQVNSTASALARGQLESIGFVGPDPTNPFFSMVLEGLTRHLDGTFSLTVLLPEGGEDYSLATAQRAMAGNLAGLILASPGTEFLESFVPTCPTVVLDAGGRPGTCPASISTCAAPSASSPGTWPHSGIAGSATSGSAGRRRSPWGTAGRSCGPGCCSTAAAWPWTTWCWTA